MRSCVNPSVSVGRLLPLWSRTARGGAHREAQEGERRPLTDTLTIYIFRYVLRHNGVMS
ncbi:hypothetical protein BURKHO8Y_10416 [Burkholderia sp. 8Y]|nr:hypothetical protein BURKHO8Y_10416 [Burkholderia sp. 8Y]